MGTYMLAALPILRGDNTSFIGSTFHAIEKAYTTDGALLLYNRVAMHEFYEFFPADRQNIRELRINGKQPYAVSLPKELDWKRIKSFPELLRQIAKSDFQT
jgi:hypothetical protein